MIAPATLREVILKSGFISASDFDAAVKTAADLGKPLTDVLIYRGLISEDILGQLVAEHYRVPYVNLSHKTAEDEVLQLVSEEAATTFRIFPFTLAGNVIHLATEDPTDIEAREFVKRKTGHNLKIFYSPGPNLEKSWGQYKRNLTEVFETIIHENVQKSSAEIQDESQLAHDLPIVTILDTLLEYAVAESASDVHFEIQENNLLVRFRIDGILKDVLSLPKNIHSGIVARVKILSQLKIDEHRIPQDGRFKVKIKDAFIALRVSLLPAFYGENIVMRILPESARPLSLGELGLTSHNLELVKSNIKKPHGMILVTRPTGSGKTTTLYSILTILNTTEVKICTIEDPVEYGIKRVNQIQINPAAGLTFAAGLRSLLRHDPDIVMVGETRDRETAEMAIHSALTGHLVLSTLHTNDAAGAIPRFLDMGAEGFLVASTMNLVVAQRLVRKICTSCIESYTPTGELFDYLKKVVGEQILSKTYYRGKGCPVCRGKGYKGRIGIYEVLEINDEIRQLIIKQTAAVEIAKMGSKNGMAPLIVDGINKAGAGITTIEEVLRVVRE